MKKTFPLILVVLSFGLLLWGTSGCRPKVVVKPKPVEVVRDHFAIAERMFERQDFDKALEHYAIYLNQHPNTPLVPPALMKMAKIYAVKGQYETARDLYEKVISEYPQTVFSADAEVEILVILYKDSNFEELIRRGSGISKEMMSRDQLVRIYMLMGESFLALEAQVNAAYSFIMAHGQANEIEREILLNKIKNIILELNAADIGILLSRLENLEDIELVDTLHRLALFNVDTIGCLLPLSGPYEKIGNRALKGIELALNRFGTQNGYSFKIIVKDTRSDPSRILPCIRELIDEKAACIIGPIVTSLTGAEIAQNEKIPIITLSQKNDIPEKGDFVFRNFLTPRMQVKTLVSYAVNQLGVQRFAILYPNEKYGNTFMNLFWDEVIENQGSIVGVESYDADQTDFANPVKKLVGLYYDVPEDLKFNMVEPIDEENVQETGILHSGNFFESSAPFYNWIEGLRFLSIHIGKEMKKKAEDEEEPDPIIDFDGLFLPDSPKKAGLIIPQLAYYDIENVYLLGPNLWHSDELIDMAGSYVQGAILTEGFYHKSQSVPVKNFMAAFQKTYGERPSFIEAIAYDTAVILFNILSRGDYQLRSDIRDALLEMENFDGVTGITSFEANGEANKVLKLLKVRGKRFIELKH